MIWNETRTKLPLNLTKNFVQVVKLQLPVMLERNKYMFCR